MRNLKFYFFSKFRFLSFFRERRCLIFRPFLGNINQTVPDPEDYGYNFRTTSGVKIIISTLKDNGFNQTSSSKNWILHWQVGRCKAQLYTGLQSHQKVNRFPMSYEITRKDKMNRNISQMALKFGKSYNFVPKTYLLPQELALLMRDGEKKRYQKKYYICKPNASSQGKGIYVTDDIEMVSSLQKNEKSGKFKFFQKFSKSNFFLKLKFCDFLKFFNF